MLPLCRYRSAPGTNRPPARPSADCPPCTQQGADRIGEHADVGVVIVTARRQVVLPTRTPFRYARNIPSPVISSIAPAQAPSARKVVYRATGPRGQRSSGVIHRGVFRLSVVSGTWYSAPFAHSFRRYFPVLPPGGQFMPVLCAGSEKYHIFRVPIRARFDYNRVQVPRIRAMRAMPERPLRIARCA